MRLINADKLNLNLCNTVGDAKREIDNAPTVDVIPVDWIKEWVDKNTGYTGYTSYLVSVVEMLDDWEKENA